MTGRPSGSHTWLLALLLPLLWSSQPVSAQAPQPQELTEEAIAAALELYNRAGTVRMSGDSRVAAGSEIVGDLSVLEGDLVIEGTVRGDVLVLNGDLQLGPSARIEGSATVIGGSYEAAEGAAVARGVALYRGSFSFRIEDDVLVRVARLEGSRVAELAAGRDFEFGRTDVIVTAGRGYNRVEGLPIYFGPRFTLGHSNPTVLEALLTYRTSTGLDVDNEQLGYSLRAEQYLGGWRAVRVGARAFSEITPIELGGLSDRENSLAAFVLHRDYRDHYERDGWAAYVSVAPLNRSWSAGVEYAEQREGSLRARRPWSLIDNSKSWRPQPLAATGAVRSITVRAAYDSRNHDNDPSNGWWLSAALERALGGSLRTITDSATTPAPRRFTDAVIDLRRYARLGPNSRLAVRVELLGSVDGDALPVQRQHALGGEGSLPGFELHRFDCGARHTAVRVNGQTYREYYGCDRAALIQLEYQTDIAFLRRLDSPIDPLGLLQRVRLAAFFDAGRAWNERAAAGTRGTGNSDFSADAGFGIRLGPVGLYWALPLSGVGETMNFFIRLGPRI